MNRCPLFTRPPRWVITACLVLAAPAAAAGQAEFPLPVRQARQPLLRRAGKYLHPDRAACDRMEVGRQFLFPRHSQRRTPGRFQRQGPLRRMVSDPEPRQGFGQEAPMGADPGYLGHRRHQFRRRRQRPQISARGASLLEGAGFRLSQHRRHGIPRREQRRRQRGCSSGPATASRSTSTGRCRFDWAANPS